MKYVRRTTAEAEAHRIDALLYPERGFWRPRTRGDCADVARPCPYVGCRYHLYLEVRPRSGRLHIVGAGEPDELVESCALDVADRGPATLEDLGDALDMTREGARLVVEAALLKVRRGLESA